MNSAVIKKTEAFESFVFYGFIVFLATFAFEGVLRFGLSKVGASSLIYLRDLLEVLTVLLIFIRTLFIKKYIDLPILSALGILVLHFLISLLMGTALFQALYGFKIYFPVIYGLSIWPIISKRFKLLMITLLWFFVTAVIGVYINKLLGQMPWEGNFYDTAFGTVAGTKVWTTFGQSRLPGFARASYDAAMVIAISGLAGLVLFTKAYIRLLISIAAFTAIYLTTSKGMIQAFFILAFVFLIFRSDSINSRVSKILAIFLGLISIFMPVFVTFFDITSTVNMRNVPTILLSLWERFSWMWPDGFGILKHWYQYVIGAGLGSIGIPAQFTLPLGYGWSADNFFVDAYVNFGLLSLIYIGYLLFKIASFKSNHLLTGWVNGYFILFFAYGATTNLIGSPFLAVFLGLSFGIFAYSHSIKLDYSNDK